MHFVNLFVHSTYYPMKISRILVAFFICFLVLSSACNREAGPGDVAIKFITSVDRMKFDEAKQYCTPETAKMVDFMNTLMQMNPKNIPEKKFEVLEEEINGDKAIVRYKEEGKSKIDFINLVKVDHKWKVVVSKEDIGAKGQPGLNSLPLVPSNVSK